MKSSIPKIIGWDMIENQIYYVNKMLDVKQEYNPILVESDVISAGDWRYLGRRLAFSRPAIGVLSAGDWRSQQRRSTLLSLLSFDANNLSLSFYTSIWSGDGLKISGDGCMSYQKFFIPLHSITVLECFRITFR